LKSIENIHSFLADFQPISLPELDSVKLLNRAEKKYIMHFSRVMDVLNAARTEYKVLEINGHRLMQYSTEYFDTQDNAMYFAHHNGKQSRFKVRKREYVISGEQFLEVKRRTNSGRTQKKRVELQGNEIDSANGQVFIEAVTPYKLDSLEMKLVNTFHRVTLVNIALKERITMDVGLIFKNQESVIQLPAVAIIEIKFDKTIKEHGFDSIMRKLRIHDSSVSNTVSGGPFWNQN
jgi:hypothetical protein